MRRHARMLVSLLVPASLGAQSSTAHEAPTAVSFQFTRFADMYGGRLLAAFTSIPAAQYNYRPTASQQTIGYIAQHLEGANYSLCERLGSVKHLQTAKDSLADTVKALRPLISQSRVLSLT